jgi:ABC-type Fe3+/spermidine/putrescine transport system ATPase subunit
MSVASFIGEANFLPGEVEGETSRVGYWSVNTGHGRFWGQITDPSLRPQAGDLVTLCMRPEALRLTDQPEKINTITGHLADSIYLGEMAQYQVRDDRGRSFRLTENNPLGLRANSQDMVHIVADPADVMILRK